MLTNSDHPYITEVKPHIDTAILACKRHGFDLFFLTVLGLGHSVHEFTNNHGFLIVSNGEKPHSWTTEVVGAAGTR